MGNYVDPAVKEQAIVLMAQGRSCAEIREALKVNKNTLTRWRKEVTFNRLVDEASIAIARQSLRRAVGYSREVVDFYHDTLHDPEVPIEHRIKAAKEIMNCLNLSLSEVYSRRLEEAERILQGDFIETTTTIVEEVKPRQIDMETL